MILHVINDSLFIARGLSHFNKAYPNKPRTLLVTKSRTLKYLQFEPDVKLLRLRELFSARALKEIRSADAIILHSSKNVGFLVSLLAKKTTKILWIGYGFDYYNLLAKRGYEFYGLETKALYDKQHTKKLDVSLKHRIHVLIDSFIMKSAFRRIDFFSPVIREDYDLFKEYFPKIRMTYVPWSYGDSLENSVYSDSLPTPGPNILIGNSASYTNNHLEVFSLLRNVDLRGRKLIVPLSYGDKEYRDHIITIGRNLFGDSFMPLVDFMPIDAYYSLIKSCSIVFMNHYRQQATCNITAMIAFGAKLYLSKKNPYYMNCINRDLKICAIEELTSDSSSLFSLLSESERSLNRKIVQDTESQEIIDAQTRTILDLLLPAGR